MENQTIIGLRVSGLRKIEAVAIEGIDPTGVIKICGKNDQGKSTILDSVSMAFSGDGSLPDNAIKNGKDAAEVVVETQDLIITKKKKRGKPASLDVEVKRNKSADWDGKAPQGFLDLLTEKGIGFDPFAIRHQDPKKFAESLLKICPAGIDLAKNKMEIDQAYQERRDLARDRDRLAARVPAEIPDGPDQITEVAVLVERRRSIDGVQRRIEGVKHIIETSQARKDAIEEEIQVLQNEFAKLSGNIESCQDEMKVLNGRLKELGDPKAVDEKIKNVQQENSKYVARQEAKRLKDELEKAERMVSEAEKRLESARQVRKDALAHAKFPIKGLSIDDEGSATYKGAAFPGQASSSEIIEVGMAIGMAGKPKFKVVLIREATLLDREKMARAVQIAKENGYQVFLEIVGEPDEKDSNTFVIVDGSVKD